jgi:N-ethylmaleimide reductase
MAHVPISRHLIDFLDQPEPPIVNPGSSAWGLSLRRSRLDECRGVTEDPLSMNDLHKPQTDLFSPVTVGRYTLRNRIAMAPMTRDRSPDAIPNALNKRYYAQRASAGLIITEGTAPAPMGVGYIDIPGMWSEAQARGWKEIADAVHAEDGRIFVQLMYVGRMSHPSFLGGATPLAPSAVKPAGTVFTKEGPAPLVTPRAMSEDEIEAALDSFADAARLAVGAAGLDGVEVHGANGYLPMQFISANTNQRTDGWGGDIARRARFHLEAMDRVIAAIGGDRVGLRISPGSTFNDIDDPEWPKTYAYLLEELNKRRFAYLHVVVPPTSGLNDLPDVPAMVRERFKGTVILAGGYDKARAEADLAQGRADMISFARLFLANPDLPERLRRNAELNTPDPATFYSGGEKGYIDYPALGESATA